MNKRLITFLPILSLSATSLFSVSSASTPQVIRVEQGALSDANVATGLPSFYVNSEIDRVPDNFRSGFGWYSTAGIRERKTDKESIDKNASSLLFIYRE